MNGVSETLPYDDQMSYCFEGSNGGGLGQCFISGGQVISMWPDEAAAISMAKSIMMFMYWVFIYKYFFLLHVRHDVSL